MRYSNKYFLIAKHFEMKEKASFKWGMICYLIKKNHFILNIIKIQYLICSNLLHFEIK